MAVYRKAFDERLPAIDQAIKNMSGDIGASVPGFSREGLRRFFHRFSVQLGRLDKRGAKHPQFLIMDGYLLPLYITDSIDNALSQIASGAAAFAQGDLALFVRMQNHLDQAIGTDADELRGISSAVTADLSTSVARADELVNSAQASSLSIDSLRHASAKRAEEMEQFVDKAKGDAERAATARRAVEQLINPDGRSRTSLEALARRARERVEEINTANDVVTQAQTAAGKAASDAAERLTDATAIVATLEELKTQASQILNLSSQAGLAASYSREAQTLANRSWWFTAILYSASLITALVAAFYVLPELTRALGQVGTGVSVGETISLTILRIGVLAPLIYVIFFSTRQISTLELLRMDYAEKAAASLAYSGYREQMDTDDDLLRQLKGSLLIKFAEHPERLLRPDSTTTTAKFKTPGFEAETTVSSKPKLKLDDNEDA